MFLYLEKNQVSQHNISQILMAEEQIFFDACPVEQ